MAQPGQVARVGRYPITMWERIRQGVSADVRLQTIEKSNNLSLHSVKKVQFNFDPFVPTNASLREFMCILHRSRIRQTNPGCKFKIDLLNDRTESTIELDLIDGKKLKLCTENLTLLEILTTWVKYAPAAVPKSQTAK